ncbi:MAG: LPS export ABC transporter periplasmic protein LptC [Vicinamibacterales bacterium]
MTAWQRRARSFAAVVGLAVAVGAYWAAGNRRTVAPPPPVTPFEPTVTAVTRGGDAAQSRGAREDFALEFVEQKSYSDGRTVATGLTVRVGNRGGRSFVVTGKEGTIGAEQSSVAMQGDVKLTASDGLVATAETATYANGEGIVRAPGPVAFTRGGTHGRGVGFSYDTNRDTMWILDQAEIHVAGADDSSAMDVTAGAFGEARRDRYLRLERGVTLVRPGQTIEADEAMVYLLPDRDEPDRIELRGNARIAGGEGMGTLRGMSARDINLDYADDGRTLQHATLVGQGQVTLAGASAAQPGQQLGAEFIDLAVGPDGAITSLDSRERVVVTLPAAGPTPARSIRSVELTGAGAAGGGLTSMRFQQQVEFREGSTAGRPSRVARSRALTVALTADGVLDRATFTGQARFTDGSLEGIAAEARYFVADDRLVLTGRDGPTRPRVTDTGVQIEGDEITVGLAANTMQATGDVSSVMQPAAARAGDGPARTPALLDGGQAVFASAAGLEYDSRQRRGTYTGRARLWQGDTTIRAERIVLDEGRGDLEAGGGVQSTLAIASPAAADAAPPATPARGTIARGETMRFTDAARAVTYTTGARVSGPQGDLAADRIELVLAESGRDLARIEGYGSVEARVDGRDARGARLTHLTSDGRYVLTGTPVQFTEDCRVTTGRTLTFYGSAGRIIVDGNDATRTTTKGGGRCTPTPQ